MLGHVCGRAGLLVHGLLAPGVQGWSVPPSMALLLGVATHIDIFKAL